MSANASLDRLPSFQAPLQRKERPSVEPLVGLARLAKQLEDVSAAVSDPTWMVNELRALLKTIRSSVELLKPQTQDWASVALELKGLVSAISALLKRVVVSFEKHVTNAAEFTNYINDIAFVTDFNKVMVNTHALQHFLLRFGINGGLVSEVGCAQYTLPTTMWRYSVTYLPNRNLLFVPRVTEMRRIENALKPTAVISYNCLTPSQGVSGVGITELLTEYCYRSVEDGRYGAVAWITGSTASAIALSFRYFANRIRNSDKSFCKNGDEISKMNGQEVIAKVIEWLQKLSYAWLLVFDGMSNEYCMQKSIVPQFGSGSVVFTTYTSCIGRIKDLCSAKAELMEINLLAHSEKLAIANCLLNYAETKFSEADIIELLKYFGGHPLEIIESCSVINAGNNRLQWNVGIQQYLNKLKFAQARGLLERELVVYQTLNAALEVAVQLPRTSAMAVTMLLDLLPYVDASEVDARLVLKWLLTSEDALSLAVVEDDLNMIRDSDLAVLSMDTMMTVTVTSMIPHDLHSNGGTYHTWKIQKTFVELQTFFDDMKKSTDSLATVRFPGKPRSRGTVQPVDVPIKVSLGDINLALHTLCADPAWAALCADGDVKEFIGIQSHEDVFADAGSRVFSLLEPLASVGVVRMKHTFGLIDTHDQCVSFSVCGDFHRAMASMVQQEGREQGVLDRVHRFLLECMQEGGTGGGGGGGGGSNKSLGGSGSPAARALPLEAVIPHAIRAASFGRHTEPCLALLASAYASAERLGLTADRAQLAAAGLLLVQDSRCKHRDTVEEVRWFMRDAQSAMAMDLFEKASASLNQVLGLATHLNLKYEIAVIQGMLAMATERLEKYSDTENHLVKSLEAWQLCFHASKQRDVANCLQQLARVYRITHKVVRSLEFDNMAIDLLIVMHGVGSEQVHGAQLQFGTMLMKYGKHDAAIAVLTKILQSYDAEDGIPNTALLLAELKLTNPKSTTVVMEIATCFMAKKMFVDAEVLLNQCLDALFDTCRDRPNMSVSLVLDKIGQVQTDQGNLEAALKSFKDSLDICRCILDSSDIRIAHLMNRIGNHLKLMGKFAFAESYYKGSIEIFEKMPCRDAAHALITLADTLVSQDRADEALVAASKSVAMYRRIDTSDDVLAYELAVAMTLEADILREQGSLDRALQRLEDVQFTLDHMQADNDVSAAEVYEKMADVYRLKGDVAEEARCEQLANTLYGRAGGEGSAAEGGKKLSKPLGPGAGKAKAAAASSPEAPPADPAGQAEALTQRQGSFEAMDKKEEEDQTFLRMQEEVITNIILKYGETHQRVASALNNLSHLLIKKGRFEEAQRMLVASLEILLALYGDTHAHVATVYQNIGHLYQRRGRHEEAGALFQQALSVRRELSGDVSAAVAQSLNSLGLVFRAQGKYVDAKLCMEESLNIRRVLYGHSHFSIAVALNNLGMLQKAMWLFKEAEKSLRDSIAIRKATFEEGHPSIAASMANLGTLLVAMGKLTEARKLFEDALAIQKKAYGDKTHPDIAKSMTCLADLNIKENKLTSAKTVLEELVRSRSDIHGAQNEDFYLNISRLSRLYHAMNLDEEGNKLDHILVERPTGLRSKVEDKFVMLPEIEEDDRIVSRLMSTGGSFMDGNGGHMPRNGNGNMKLDILQHNRNHNFLTHDHEETPRWLASVNEAATGLYRKRRVEVESALDLSAALEFSFGEAEAELQGLRDSLEENKSKIGKLEKLAAQNSKYEREMIDVRYDSANMEKEIEIALSRRTEMEEDLERATSHNSSSKKSLQKMEEIMPKFETLRVSVLGSITIIESKNESLFQKRQQIAQLMESGGGGAQQEQEQLAAAEGQRAELEAGLRAEHACQDQWLEDMHGLCQHMGIDIDLPVSQRQAEGGVKDGSKGKKSRHKAKTCGEESVGDDDDTSIDSFGSNEASDSDEETDTRGDSKNSKTVQKLKKKLKRQKMLLDLLRSQLLGLGVRPIEEVVSYDRAEARLKEALQRLLEGNEDAAADFERWDEYVRNHPEYKRRELEKIALWQSENSPLNAAALYNAKSYVPVDIYTCTKDHVFSSLPKPLARRVWNEKSLWLLRMSPALIAKLHIADLQSKYSTQSLDEIELRAVYAVMPPKFENDSTGEKEGWRAGILQRLQSKRTQLPWSGAGAPPPEEVVIMFMKSITRNGAYR
jgi:tetratricopeptide (TPR) repeat protein